MQNVEQRLIELKETLHDHAIRYYVEDAPTIPDAEYDRMMWMKLNALGKIGDTVVIRRARGMWVSL